MARKAARGDREAIEALYEEHSERLFALAYRLTASSADARDVIQDVFLKLPQALRRFARARPLGPWLRAVTARAALDRVRTEQRRREIPIGAALDELPQLDSPEFPVLDSIAAERALSVLPEELRRVAVLRGMEGCSHRQIAEMLGVSKRTSQRRWQEALKRLRAELFDSKEE